MPIELCPIQKSDAKVVTEMLFQAFENSPVTRLIYSVPASPSIKAWTVEHALKGWDENPVQKRMGVRDTETGELIAFSDWYFNPQREGDDWAKTPAIEWSEEHRKDVMNGLVAEHTAMRHKIMGPKPHLFLSDLIVFPAHQRRGAGTLLLTWGIEQARTLNVPIFLTASHAGFPLYRKHGFQSVDEIVIDVSSVTSEKYSHIAMVLPAPFPSQPPKAVSTLSDSDLPNEPVAPEPSFPQVSTATPVANYDVVIEPATDDKDFVRLAEVEELAFAEDGLMQALFPPGENGASLEERGAAHIKSRLADPTNYYVKATSVASGQIIAWLKYHMYDDLAREHIPYNKELPTGANMPLLEASFGDLTKCREKAMEGKQYGFVLVLVTVPEWHRRGVGRKLLQRYLDLVDEKGWDSWIDASPVGMRLYQKFGWEEMGRTSVDLGDFGGEKGKVETTVGMLRKARVKNKDNTNEKEKANGEEESVLAEM
ncbi:hypothetical protein MMC13_004614 [Lambiella insularis]|nr:hypothetical protein [Lambiella insularis]